MCIVKWLVQLEAEGTQAQGVEWHVRPLNPKNPIVFFDVTIGNIPAGRIKMEIFVDIAPKTAENFRQFCTGEYRRAGLHVGYKACQFHRVIKDCMIQAGDFVKIILCLPDDAEVSNEIWDEVIEWMKFLRFAVLLLLLLTVYLFFPTQLLEAGLSESSNPRMSESDLQVSKHRLSIFLSTHTAYELLPQSGKVVALDITLPVKQAFHALYQEGISMAPVWDSNKCQFVGMLSAMDFILILKELSVEVRKNENLPNVLPVVIDITVKLLDETHVLKEKMNERLRDYEAELKRKKDERLNELEDSSRSPFKDGPPTDVGIQRHRVTTMRHNRCRKVIRTDGDGSGCVSIYGLKFDDENFTAKHTGPGLLSMANSGPNTNGCQFFITCAKCDWLDNKHVVFGRVLGDGLLVVRKIENGATGPNNRPKLACVIAECGEM
ncbi:hypothetical protein JHK86_043432 [Glycine max]|nr:hypothetical protein JHK86_043432 [Glycine max]